MVATLIDGSVDAGGEGMRAPTRTQVIVDDSTIYVFTIDNETDIAYWKSTDAGVTWSTAVTWAHGTSGSQWYDIYYEKWNSAGGRNIVHLVHHYDAGAVPLSGIYYRQLNLDTDTLSAAVLAVPLGGSPDNGTHGFGLARDGTLYIASNSLATDRVGYKSVNDGVTWSATAVELAEYSQQDQLTIWADFESSDPADLIAIYWDDSSSEISLKRYDVSADTTSEVVFGTSMDKPADSAANMSSALDRSTGHIMVAALEVSGAGSNNLKTWDVYGATATARTNVVSATTYVQCVALAITQLGIDCFYGRDASAAALSSIEIYRKRSTDTMVTWGAETVYTSRASGATYRIMADPYSTANVFAPAWEEDTGDDLYIEAPATTLVPQYRLMLSDGADPDVPVLNITGYNIPGSPLIRTERGRDMAVLGNPPRAGQASLILNNVGLHWGLDEPTPGLAVRLNKMLSGVWYHLWQGNLDIPEHTMTAYRPTITVRALGPLTKLAGKTVSTNLYQDITVGVAIGHLLDAANFPSHLRDIDAGEVTLPYWWCSNGDAMTEMQKLINSEGITAELYEKGDGKLVFRSRNARYTETRSTTAQSTFRNEATDPWVTDFQYFSGYREIVNAASHERYRRTNDTVASVVWDDVPDFNYIVPPGGSITVEAVADEPFFDAITPVAGVDYLYGFDAPTVTLERTSGQRTKITFTTGVGGTTLTGLQLRAIATINNATYVETSTINATASIAAYGQRSWSGEMSKELDWATMRDNLDAIVLLKKDPRGRFRFSINAATGTLANTATAQREIGDRVRLIETALGFDGVGWIERIEHQVDAPAGPTDGTSVGSEATTYEVSLITREGTPGAGVGEDDPYEQIDNSGNTSTEEGVDDDHGIPTRGAHIFGSSGGGSGSGGGGSGGSGGGGGTPLTFMYDPTLFENPGRGREESFESDPAIGGGSGTLATEGIASYEHRVARRYWWPPQADAVLSAGFLTGFEADIDAAVAAGKLLNGKVAYFDADVPHLSKARIDGHIAQLLPIINAKHYAFHTFELGFFGRWGEFHTVNSAGWTDPADRSQPQPQTRALFETVAAATPSTLWIGMRYPEVAIYLEGVLSAANFARMAIFNDGYMASTDGGAVAFDNGTFPGAYSDGLDLTRRAWLANFGLTHPVRGESDVDVPGSDDHFARTGDNAIYHGLQRQHLDAFRDWYPSTSLTTIALDPLNFTDRYYRELGYRLLITRARIPLAAVNNTEFNFDLEIENIGVAPPRRNYVAKVKFGTTGNTATTAWVTANMFSVNVDANNLPTTTGAATNTTSWLGWQSTSQTTGKRWVRFSCIVPAGLSGTYPIYLALIDPNTELQGNIAYNIRLANAGTWDSTNGRNNLLTDVVVT